MKLKKAKVKLSKWYYIKAWFRWRLHATWLIIRDHCKREGDYCLHWYSKIWISFKCWLAIILGRHVEDKHFPDDIPSYMRDYPDGIEVASYGFHKSYSMEFGECGDWTEIRYADVKGIRLRYTELNQGYP